MTTQFNSLSQCVSYYHRRIDELLMLHQEALVIQDFPLAQKALRIFAKFLNKHLTLENELLIPAHDSLGCNKQWRTQVYKEEHSKLVDLLDNIRHMLSKEPAEERMRRWVIEVIDYERTFKNVMEHHEEREEKGLLLEIDNYLERFELEKLITQCHLGWQEDYEALREDIEDIRAALP